MKCTDPTWYIFRNDDILVKEDYTLPQIFDPSEAGLKLVRQKTLEFPSRNTLCWAETAIDADPPSGMKFISRRHLLDLMDSDDFAPAGLAYHFMNWTRNNQYCGRCGTPMEDSREENARLCPRCGYLTFPVVTPAIIVAVEKEGKILLGRSPRFPKGRYSVLAGFVEPGEMLKDTVKREVMEEVSVEVDHIAYFSSQPWPFPHSLMLGFTAKWKSGDIKIDGVEIEDAGWYSPEEIPNAPSTKSISGELIRDFIERHSKGR